MKLAFFTLFSLFFASQSFATDPTALQGNWLGVVCHVEDGWSYRVQVVVEDDRLLLATHSYSTTNCTGRAKTRKTPGTFTTVTSTPLSITIRLTALRAKKDDDIVAATIRFDEDAFPKRMMMTVTAATVKAGDGSRNLDPDTVHDLFGREWLRMR